MVLDLFLSVVFFWERYLTTEKVGTTA